MKLHLSTASAYLFLIVVYVWIFFFTSCKQKTDYSKEITSLDSALVKLKKAELQFLSADTVSIQGSYEFTKEKLHEIAEKLSKDTVKKKTATLLASTYEQTGNLQNLLDNKKYILRAINEARQRISNLEHDLKEDLIEKNKSTEYVTDEINTSEKIIQVAGNTFEKAKCSVLKLDSLKTPIISLSDSLKGLKTK